MHEVYYDCYVSSLPLKVIIHNHSLIRDYAYISYVAKAASFMN
jgi:hypothetical protein